MTSRSEVDIVRHSPYIRGVRVEAQITSKNQLTLPREVRRALGVADGDRLEFSIEGDKITVRKAGTRAEDPFSAFHEWSTEADQEAYGKL